MKTIYKYELEPINDINAVNLPMDSVILSTNTQGNGIFIWAEVESTNLHIDRYFTVIPTGGNIPMWSEFIGTVMLNGGSLVFHVYEIKDM